MNKHILLVASIILERHGWKISMPEDPPMSFLTPKQSQLQADLSRMQEHFRVSSWLHLHIVSDRVYIYIYIYICIYQYLYLKVRYGYVYTCVYVCVYIYSVQAHCV